jgi:PAS domain S-box-containing protein
MARRPLTGFASGTQHTAAGWLLLTVAVAIAYFLAARLGLALLSKPDGVAVFWPAAGVSAGLLIALGPSARWSVVIGAMAATIAANLMGDRNVGSALVFAVCNAGEALIIATLIERYFGTPFGLDRLSHVIGFLGAAVAGTTISGIGGTLGFLMHHGTAPILMTWYHWVTSDGLGVITVAPLLIGLRASVRDPPSHRETFEGGAALGTLILLSLVLIFLPSERWATILAIAALFPLLLWLGARCRPVFSSAAAFIVSLTIVCTITFGIGVFGDTSFPVAERILSAQAGILAVALCSYVLAALFEERRRHEAMLMESEARLQEALTAGGVAAFDWEVVSDKSRRSDNAALILGFDAKQSFGGAEFFARVHPSDQPQLLAQLRDLRPERPILDSTFRFVRQDGREIWLEQTAKAEFDAAGELLRMRGLTLDITDRKHAEQRQDLLIAELDHRVKNVLARVAVVVRQTREGSSSMDHFVGSLDGRIQSMAAAHSLLSQTRWRGVGINDLVRDQLAPYASQANVKIAGPNIVLSATATQALAMVLHELATNAAKYGALSTNGAVSVTWQKPVADNGGTTLTVVWQEFDGPPVKAPRQSGFGTSLIRDLIPHELGGRVELMFESNGVICRIDIPLAGT